MEISLIVAVAENGVIGREGALPWRLSHDLRRFKRLTMGHHLVVGRKSYESIGRPLPGRTLLIVTRQPDYAPPAAAPGDDRGSVAVVHSLDAACERARRAGESELFVAGGGEIYRLALPRADRIYRTRVHVRSDGDVTFPQLAGEEWTVRESERYGTDERNEYPTTFERLERASAG